MVSGRSSGCYGKRKRTYSIRQSAASYLGVAKTTVIANASGLPGGYRNNNGNYNNIGNNGNWWSASENSTTNAWNRNLNYNNGNVNRNNNNKQNGFSVRCLRDLMETCPRA
jgi:uncharacterized protein (TIGR02145 family)